MKIHSMASNHILIEEGDIVFSIILEDSNLIISSTKPIKSNQKEKYVEIGVEK